MQSDKLSKTVADGDAAVLQAIKNMPEPDHTTGERLHAIISACAPDLIPRTWYGMPAYTDGGKIVCFFRTRQKFGERYMTLGFNDSAKLDDGNFWPTYFAIAKITDAEENKIGDLVKKAVRKSH